MSDDVYLRRVRDPNPFLQQLAVQAVDEIDRRKREQQPTNVGDLSAIAKEFGVPFEYILDEIERRVREAGCKHQWARRRDGRRCAKCDRVEFGEFDDDA